MKTLLALTLLTIISTGCSQTETSSREHFRFYAEALHEKKILSEQGKLKLIEVSEELESTFSKKLILTFCSEAFYNERRRRKALFRYKMLHDLAFLDTIPLDLSSAQELELLENYKKSDNDTVRTWALLYERFKLEMDIAKKTGNDSFGVVLYPHLTAIIEYVGEFKLDTNQSYIHRERSAMRQTIKSTLDDIFEIGLISEKVYLRASKKEFFQHEGELLQYLADETE
ncbi:MAG: hypothetical protein AAF740_08690 [Bacteroidota bacterium]